MIISYSPGFPFKYLHPDERLVESLKTSYWIRGDSIRNLEVFYGASLNFFKHDNVDFFRNLFTDA